MLNLKDTPRCLDGDPVEEVWPGDDAVDLDASDLALWCEKGGAEGLVFKDGATPTVIKWRPLTPQAMKACQAVAGREPSLYTIEACARGVTPSQSIGLARKIGEQRLSEASLARLGEVTMELPILVALDELARAQGQDDVPDDPNRRTMMGVSSFAELLGLHILNATFRLEGGGT